MFSRSHSIFGPKYWSWANISKFKWLWKLYLKICITEKMAVFRERDDLDNTTSFWNSVRRVRILMMPPYLLKQKFQAKIPGTPITMLHWDAPTYRSNPFPNRYISIIIWLLFVHWRILKYRDKIWWKIWPLFCAKISSNPLPHQISLHNYLPPPRSLKNPEISQQNIVKKYGCFSAQKWQKSQKIPFFSHKKGHIFSKLKISKIYTMPMWKTIFPGSEPIFSPRN